MKFAVPKLIGSECRRLLRADAGAAVIEFAVALPFLMILILGGMEFTNFVVANMRVREIAAMTADNASRLRSQMSESYVNQLFVGVSKAGDAIDFPEKGRVILSSIQTNTAGTGQWIRWQRCYGTLNRQSSFGVQDKGKNDGSLPNFNGLTAENGTAVMYAEAFYTYKPLFNNPFTTDQEIISRIAFVVRQRTDYGIFGSNPSTCT